jgi:chitinase
MNFRYLTLLLLIFISWCSAPAMAQSAKPAKYIVNGYVGGFRGLVKTELIDAKKLTHINYAFVNVQDSMAVLTNLRTDSTNFRKLNELKKINPDL